jgi:hypothetical protein
MDLVEMMRTIVFAVFQVGIPAFSATYLLVWWALRHSYFEEAASLKQLVKSAKRHSKAKKIRKKEEKKQKKALNKSKGEAVDAPEPDATSAPLKELNPVHNKWLTFGGGFYGLMALLTYTLIEIDEIMGFFANFSGLMDFITGLSLGLLIDLLVNSIINLVAAAMWPFYWMNMIDSEYPWVWFVVAYIGYWTGAKFAFRKHLNSTAGSETEH